MTTEIAKGDTMHVVVGWDDENEAPWLAEAYEGDAEDSSDRFEADIPTEMWHRIEIATKALREAFEDAAEAAGYDAEAGRLQVCCPEWRGDISPGQKWWTLELSDSGSDDEWPVGRGGSGVMFRHHHAETDAVLDLADLPERFFVHHDMGYVEVTKDRLAVVERGYRETVSSCYGCGWGRSEHANAGSEVERG